MGEASTFILGVIVGAVGIVALTAHALVSGLSRLGSDPEFQRRLQAQSRYTRSYKVTLA
jgi:hypothetical protein